MILKKKAHAVKKCKEIKQNKTKNTTNKTLTLNLNTRNIMVNTNSFTATWREVSSTAWQATGTLVREFAQIWP